MGLDFDALGMDKTKGKGNLFVSRVFYLLKIALTYNFHEFDYC